MNKTIIVNQDSLIKIKESMVGTDNVSHTLVCVNEARPEVDKFELGQESDNPPVGGNYAHVEENVEIEVKPNEIDLSSFKKKNELAPIWEDEETLDSRVRLRLLDIADDFWEFVNLTWVKPSGIILTGSICNFNWSKFSDIDLHLIVDFDEIDEKTEFVRDYLDSKKNEWNNEHNELTIFGFQVELYVQNLDEMPQSGGIYDLEENVWVKKPNSDDIKSIGLDKFPIKDKAAEIMTIIDDMYDALNSTEDSHEIEEIGEDASYLWKKVKNMRKMSLEKNGESGAGNIVYKILRRTNYLDKLWKLSTIVYDRSNSIDEGISKFKNAISLLKEEWVGDGNSEHNPYKERWDAERKALKDFVSNYGKLMQSRENGKLYKVYYDKTLSELIGYNYCICIQWDSVEMKPKSVLYIRALDKFSPNIKQVSFDTRGRDNQRGTYDDLSYQQRVESKKKDSIVETVNELGLYHSSYNSFDKFNHKKYMSSGAGSQTFGWGTYLTDSYLVAKDYAEKFILYKFNEFIVDQKAEDYLDSNMGYNDDIVNEAIHIYKAILVRMAYTFGLDRKYTKNYFYREFPIKDPIKEYDEEYSRYQEYRKECLERYKEANKEVTDEIEQMILKAFHIMCGSTKSYESILETPRDEYIEQTNMKNAISKIGRYITDKVWAAAEEHVKKESYIYEVEVPDDNGLNYIDWNNIVSQEALEKVRNGLVQISKRFKNDAKIAEEWDNIISRYNNNIKGKMVLIKVDELLTGEENSFGEPSKITSLFLMNCGFDGIKYKAGTIYGLPEGADENSLNYVIFDSNKIRITSKNLFTDTF